MKKTILGPFNKLEAIDTAKQLGRQYSAFCLQLNDADGFVDDVASALNWFVEKDDDVIAERIFGMSWEEIKAKQQKKEVTK